MSSLLRAVKKRKKSHVLGEVEVVSRDEYKGLELDSKVEMIRALIPLGLMHVEELLDQEVKALAGERYARKEATLRGRRYGSNPGTVGVGRSAGAHPHSPGSEHRRWRGRGGDLPGRENVCRHDDGGGLGHHDDGRQTLLGLRGDEYGKRGGADTVSPFIDGARPEHL